MVLVHDLSSAETTQTRARQLGPENCTNVLFEISGCRAAFLDTKDARRYQVSAQVNGRFLAGFGSIATNNVSCQSSFRPEMDGEDPYISRGRFDSANVSDLGSHSWLLAAQPKSVRKQFLYLPRF
ncbi:hypothetical protein CEP52_017415 [Fusarium oligoseptatum]|uniref:Uncharacterized protein n=1 Tax=Fusarium oligoseptatum TaxID=2604345 RepID=A0A428RRT9_9HYPO|nr:hypothetical protein CEP52_017415 [Fusarium oligoseptatum]